MNFFLANESFISDSLGMDNLTDMAKAKEDCLKLWRHLADNPEDSKYIGGGRVGVDIRSYRNGCPLCGHFWKVDTDGWRMMFRCHGCPLYEAGRHCGDEDSCVEGGAPANGPLYSLWEDEQLDEIPIGDGKYLPGGGYSEESLAIRKGVAETIVAIVSAWDVGDSR